MVDISHLLQRLESLSERELAGIASYAGLEPSQPRGRIVREISDRVMMEDKPLTWFVKLLMGALPDRAVRKFLGYEGRWDRLLEKLGRGVGRGMAGYRDVGVDNLRADLILYSSEVGSYGSLVPAPEIKHSLTAVTCIREPAEFEDCVNRALGLDGYVDRIYLGANTYAVLAHLIGRGVEWSEFTEFLNSRDIGLVRLDYGGEAVVDRLAGVRGFEPERYMRLVEILGRSKPFKKF